MPDSPDPMFKPALEKLAEHERAAYEIKLWINQGCIFQGRAPMFSDIEAPGESAGPSTLKIGPDDFFNKPMATAVRDVLTKREQAGMTRAASIDEIHALLVQGGFAFPSNDIDKQKMGLAVSLGKNTVTFRKLPSGLFGLAEWYGANKGPTKTRRRSVIVNGELRTIEEEAESDEDEATESPDSDNSVASGPTPNSADEDGREVVHDNMTDLA